MLSLGAAWVSVSPQNTALTPNQPAQAALNARQPAATWADHPETDLLSRGDQQPAAKSHSVHPEEARRVNTYSVHPEAADGKVALPTPTETSGWRPSDGSSFARKDGWRAADGSRLSDQAAEIAQASGQSTYLCTDIAFEKGELSVHNFGGADYCCNVCNGNTAICCPSKDASGDAVRQPPPSRQALPPAPQLFSLHSCR